MLSRSRIEATDLYVALALGEHRLLLFQDVAADPEPHHLPRQIQDASSCGQCAQSMVMNVGYEVSIRVGMRSARLVGHICRHTFCRRKAWALAYQENNDLRLQQFANLI